MDRLTTQSETEPVRPRVLVIGGQDVHAHIELMRGLSGVFTLAAAGTSPDLEPSFAKHGFSYYYYPLGRAVGPLADVSALVALGRLLRHFRPHVVHAFDTKPGVYGCLAARLTGVPVVIGTVTGLGSLYGENGLALRIVRSIYESLQRFASRQADLTIFQNRDDRREFVRRGVVPVDKAALICGSGVATERFDAARVSETQRQDLRAELGVPPDTAGHDDVARRAQQGR